MRIEVVILAAGKGERMKSLLPKILHPLWGRPLISYPMEIARALAARPIVVVTGVGSREVERACAGRDVAFVRQSPPRGTGHALLRVQASRGRFKRRVLVLLGDVPQLRVSTVRELLRFHEQRKASATVLTAVLDDPRGYGRIRRDGLGRVTGIVEELDALPHERTIREINTGIFVFEPDLLNDFLPRLKPDNRKGEYYLTDLVHLAVENGMEVAALAASDPKEGLGVNSRRELAEAHDAMRARFVERLIDEGARVLDRRTLYVDPTVRVAPGVALHPNVHLLGRTVIESDCVIGTGAVIQDSIVKRGTVVKPYSVIEESRIGPAAQVGPFSRLRPGTVVDRDVRVGNFVELKKSRLGRGTKAQHLSYLGDAIIGPGVNVGAGTITCNYDGAKKSRTILERGVFVGSDTQFVAPVRVGRGAYIGAGSTITENVPGGALALSRTEQKNVRGWVKKRRTTSK